ncbi:Extradiol ring-cleavage dioxygenase class III enzyme subunit B domain-containing protein [Halomonas sp. NYA30]|jgi:aromatic ring-opening dioxygenase catalytic subunit (LigB family)
MMNTSPDILFLSHGGGPLPLLGDPAHQEMVELLKGIANVISKPSAILVISAHWEASVPTITSGAAPELIYDYAGFPPEAYRIQYPCQGEPELAQQVSRALENAGIPAQQDSKRGFDHGVFVPLKIMYPEADIPCVQLSLVHNLSADTHLAIGQALNSLERENLLVIGSGFSFHNMREFFSPITQESQAKNKAFEDWLVTTCSSKDIDEAERTRRLANWDKAPHARFCHPREEHLLPLHVCYGLAGRPSDKQLSATILNKAAGMFYWSRDSTK